MIYLTGDIHGYCSIENLVNNKREKELSKEDYLIVCGDFGLPFLPTDTYSESDLSDEKLLFCRNQYRKWIKWLSERPYVVLFVDGNHDNHHYWSLQQETEWMGGKVNIHPEASNVIHLKRGEYYTIDGITFFAMGGAKSVDVARRVKDFSWWEEEIPSEKEYEHGLQNIAKHDNKVDYIITHTMSENDYCYLFNKTQSADTTEKMLAKIHQNIQYKYWYCGHYHMDKDFPELKLRILYKDIAKIGEKKPKQPMIKRGLLKINSICKRILSVFRKGDTYRVD